MKVSYGFLSAVLLVAVGLSADETPAIATYREGMDTLIRYLDGLPARGSELPSREERQDARLMWRSFLDYELALESIRGPNANFLLRKGADRDRAFRLSHAAWLAQYSAALRFIEAAERHPEYHTILNENDSTLGLVSGSYSDFKIHWLNVARAAEFSALAALAPAMGGQALPGSVDDARAIVRAGAGQGVKQTFANAVKVVQTMLWTPIPQTIQLAGGGPEKPPPRAPFITPKQIVALRRMMEPGDLIFERREWALTNTGLPGFWPHVAIYVGTAAERAARFGPELESRLRALRPAAYDKWAAANVVEALGEGVIISTLDHSAAADSVAVVRPLVPAEKKAEAILRAFSNVGKPYDFAFDFATDDRIVCTELVYKAYESVLRLPVLRLAGRSVTPANDWVRYFDEQADKAATLSFVAFLDGNAAAHAASFAQASAFRQSWRRPRWYSLATRQ